MSFRSLAWRVLSAKKLISHPPSLGGRLEQQIGHLRRKAILEKSKKYKEA